MNFDFLGKLVTKLDLEFYRGMNANEVTCTKAIAPSHFDKQYTYVYSMDTISILSCIIWSSLITETRGIDLIFQQCSSQTFVVSKLINLTSQMTPHHDQGKSSTVQFNLMPGRRLKLFNNTLHDFPIQTVYRTVITC